MHGLCILMNSFDLGCEDVTLINPLRPKFISKKNKKLVH